MSDATDELDFWGRQLLRNSRVNPLREKMRAFVSETRLPADVKRLRRQTSDGTDLADLVEEGREERV